MLIFKLTEWHSATKFGVNQILISIAMSSFCGINRICKIASFTGDGLVRALLKIDKTINENAISATYCNEFEMDYKIMNSLKEFEIKRGEAFLLINDND